MLIKKIFFLFTFLFIINVTFSQGLFGSISVESSFFNSNLFNKTSLIDTSRTCDIVLTNGMLLKEVNIIDVADSTFTVTKLGIDRIFPISQLHKITFKKNSFWPGFAAGAIGSVAIFTLLGATNGSHDKEAFGYCVMYGLFLAVPVGLITGLIAEFSGKDAEYNFGNMNADIKAKRLKFALSKNK